MTPTALTGLSSNGIVTRVDVTTFTARTITGTSNRTTVTNGDGVAGNPTIDIAATYVGQTSITTVGTIATGTWSGLFGAVSGANLTNLTAANISAGTAGISISGNAATSSSTTGNAATATALQTGRTINGTTFDGTANIVITAAATTLTGTVLNATVVTSSLTSTGILTGGATGAGFTVALTTSTITGVLPAVNGGAGTINGILKANGSGTVSLAVAGTDYVTATSTNTFTNKTYDTAGTGNSFSINGVAATANTGTGAVVRATSPTLVTPTLGVATATSINGVALTTGGSATTFLNGAGSYVSAGGITAGTVTNFGSSSAVSKNYTVPSTVKRVTISFNQVRLNGALAPTIQIGPVGGLETTGYVGNTYLIGSSVSAWTNAISLGGSSASNFYSGDIVLTLMDASANTWTIGGTVSCSTVAAQFLIYGVKSLAGALTQISLAGDGSTLFNSGTYNVEYE